MAGHVETRTNHDGSVSFRCKYVVGFDRRGQRVQGSHTFRCRPGAGKRELDATRRRAEKFLVDIESGEAADPGRLSVADILGQWHEAAGRRLGPASRRKYADIIRVHLAPALGAVPLRALTALHIEGFVGAQTDRGLAANTVRAHLAVLRAALRQAVRWRLLGHNPAEGVEPPPKPAPAGRALAAEEAAALLTAADRHPLRALWRVLLIGGLRIGEAVALRWDAVDWAAGTVVVRRTATRDAAGRRVQREGTKTGRERTVALDGGTMAALRDHRDRQAFARAIAGPRWEDQGLVFAGRLGGQRADTGAADALSRLLRRAGVAPATPHDLRRSAASFAVAAGASPAAVAAQLGHSPAMLLGAYARAGTEARRAVAAAVADAAAGRSSREVPAAGQGADETGLGTAESPG